MGNVNVWPSLGDERRRADMAEAEAARLSREVDRLSRQVAYLQDTNGALRKSLANMDAVFANDFLCDDERTRVIYEKAKRDVWREKIEAGQEMLRKMIAGEPPFERSKPVEPEGSSLA